MVPCSWSFALPSVPPASPPATAPMAAPLAPLPPELLPTTAPRIAPSAAPPTAPRWVLGPVPAQPCQSRTSAVRDGSKRCRLEFIQEKTLLVAWRFLFRRNGRNFFAEQFFRGAQPACRDLRRRRSASIWS